MNPTPAKRARKSSSPPSPAASLPRPGSSRPLRPPGSSGTAGPTSPLQPLLPRPGTGHTSHPSLPSFPHLTSVPPREAGPSTWSSNWPGGSNPNMSRRSVDPTSPSSVGSPQMDLEESTSTETGLVFSRDTSGRAPRSMMACTRCRRQKMKCDGPGNQPCRGCRQSGQPCVFEARSRPKSISVLPSRAPPFFQGASLGRPATPSSGAPPGFYPAGAQPAPPALSRAQLLEPYALRSAREPMPPPPATSLAALTAPYPPPPPSAVRTSPTVQQPLYHPQPQPPIQIPPFAAQGRPPSPPGNPESRLRALEGTMRGLSGIPASLHSLQMTLATLQQTVDSLSFSKSPTVKVEVTEAIWEDYRSRAWPLTPWLVGLREASGLPGFVVNYLGKRAMVDRSEDGRAIMQEAHRSVRKEIGRLASRTLEWTREDVRALGVFAAWTNDTPLVALAVAHGRTLGLDRIWSPRKTHDDWREWIYLSIMDHLSHLVDLTSPSTLEPIGAAWRERLSAPTASHPDPAVRDRDHKLLAWLEYAEMLAEVHSSQQALRRETAREESSTIVDAKAAEGIIEIWRRHASRWEAWAGAWAAKSDPILSLHFNYAVLFTTSPLFIARERVWEILSREVEGRALLERARDTAFTVINAVCSPEVGRTLVYSYPLYRPILAPALILLINLTSLPPLTPALISVSHVGDVLRSTYEMICAARPVDWSPSGMLGDIIERGDGRVVGEAGRDLWRKFLG